MFSLLLKPEKTRMKKISFIIPFLCISVFFNAFGQRRVVTQLPNFDKHEVHWGFYLGLNSIDYKFNYKESSTENTHVTYDKKSGFNVGLIGDIRINSNLNLRFEPGLSSSAGTINFVDDLFGGEEGTSSRFEYSSAEISATYLHLPILMKFSANRMNNIKPYVIGGFSYDHNFSSKSSNPNDNRTNVFRMQKANFMYEVGIGMDFYFPYFKFSPSIRGQFAITNELMPDNKSEAQPSSPYTDPIDFMGTQAIFIKFAFE